LAILTTSKRSIMTLSVTKKATKRFIDWWAYLGFVALSLVLLAGLVSTSFYQNILSENILVTPGQPAEFKNIELKPTAIGALRIDATALLQTNRWVTYEIRIFDREKKLLAAAVKQAWAESGRWYEDGESGTWSERDVQAGLDLRAGDRPEEITLALNILEYTDTSGQAINEPLAFRVKVFNGAIDTRYLMAGAVGTAGMAILCLFSVLGSGKKTIAKTILDSDIGDRAILGGSDKLVKLSLDITADETSPRSLRVDLWVNDGYGEQIYKQSQTVVLKFHKDDSGDITKTTGKMVCYFVFEKRASYGFYAEVTPDGPVDKTVLTVREEVRTLSGVNIVAIPQPV
jgi:hypothetical protein